jgi:dUTP pyrophosphatase
MTTTIEGGEKITQIIIQKIEQPDIIKVNEFDVTDRGENGFGSTGAK